MKIKMTEIATGAFLSRLKINLNLDIPLRFSVGSLVTIFMNT